MNGYLELTLIASGGLYMCWTLQRTRELDRWLQNSSVQPPDVGGIWGYIFDSVMLLKKNYHTSITNLQNIVTRSEESTNAIHNGLISLDKDGAIEVFNPAARHLIGLRDTDIGFSIINFIRHPKFIAYYELGNFKKSLELTSPRNPYIYLNYQITRFGKNKALVIIRDITQVYKLERIRKDFVANVSHELRTPLTVIQGYIEILHDISEPESPISSALEKMEQQARRMDKIISDLLSLSKIESTDNILVKKPVELEPLLQQIIAEAKTLSGDKKHQFKLTCAGDVCLPGTENELYSAFSNIIFNAVKYSLIESNIDIIVLTSSEKLTVQVKDQSEGIDLLHIPRLTERFYRIDSSRHSSTGGTGLGLAIAKHVLMRHNAELKISSYPGKGSSFSCVFTLPLNAGL
jgi:two-component system phosphate regulon sensor histidine kinase PhoR